MGWGVLSDAVEQQWGGAKSTSKRRNLILDVLDNCKLLWKNGKPLNDSTISAFVREVMIDDFNCEIDDSGPELISIECSKIFSDCAKGDFASARAAVERVEAAVAKRESKRGGRGAPVADDSDSDGDGEGQTAGAGDEVEEEEEEEAGGAGGDGQQEEDDGWQDAPARGRRK